MMRAADIHAAIGAAWPTVLAQLGVPESALRLKKATACPGCGGRDRYTFDNKYGRGNFFCRKCGGGDAFRLLGLVHGWSFRQALEQVKAVAGLVDVYGRDHHQTPSSRSTDRVSLDSPAYPSARVVRLIRQACPIAECPTAVSYLDSRGLWPLPDGCALRAHVAADYFEGGHRIDRFPALVAAVRDVAGELVTAHVTYLQQGQKLSEYEPRKLLSSMTGRMGCAVRLIPVGEVLGIAEGIETALSASRMNNSVPVWAALNTSLLMRFEPPENTKALLIFADNDAPGLQAAARLMERLQGRVHLELRLPPMPFNDWNDALQGSR